MTTAMAGISTATILRGAEMIWVVPMNESYASITSKVVHQYTMHVAEMLEPGMIG